MRPPDDRRRRFEDLYRANHDPVLGYVVRRTSNGHDAADVFAETFLTVWRRLDDVPAGEKARPWLFGVARRVLANHHRGERRHTALTARLASELSAIQHLREEPADMDALAEAFAELSDGYREVLSLADWEGPSAAEIGIVLGCSTTAVRIRLHRARRRLARALLEDPPRRTARAQVQEGDPV
ncbi:RNA polymerase sigma factor [Nonomuraea cavernae]|uniref:DNA-directed RNA polymerase sigma-70 factor n=1 Tax=Nonomuraea cavernae TaxID=2045107 RepID=A0A918DFX3_9ACTN|nr:sigma-70 family RNA polymerase sigma factor [Nonomuraea cavernae]MCA2184214.1 sigma-70 family RNA polymerase sigma factor [Nonomuraea cavernae]GGO62659.1 DNA-directed RNA polymerase sigma-70 factor [Nonomuraea cavernae]